MIPKIIHYCWFGNGEKSELVKKCIASWEKYCPDYEIKEWSEKSIDINSVDYMREAYEAKAWGFVPDVARLQIIYNNGGIYLDTDVELIKPLDDLLNNSCFIGMELDEYVNLGSGFGAEACNNVIKELLNEYKTLHYRLDNGEYNRIPSPKIQTKTLMRLGFKRINVMQTVMDAKIFPKDFFSPLEHNTGICDITSNTYSIHHYDGSWFTPEEKLLHNKRITIIKKYGKIKGTVVWKAYRIIYLKKKLGIKGLLLFIADKFNKYK